jgi:hypothetical protein
MKIYEVCVWRGEADDPLTTTYTNRNEAHLEFERLLEVHKDGFTVSLHTTTLPDEVTEP